MIKSMTGYGRAAVTAGGREITVELRSVNNRYLDCTVKLPRMFSFAEDAVKRRVKEAISRGKVDVYITVTQELLHYANERFREVGAQCLNLGREAQP